MTLSDSPGRNCSKIETDGLRLKHVTTRQELDRWEQDNISAAMVWLNRRRKKKLLTEEFVRELHARMFGKVWSWAGSFRRSNKNIGVAWTQVSLQLHMLLQDVQCRIDSKIYPPDEIAARFHHKLVWIHPFPNGNGRHSRLMTDALLVEVLGQQAFSWGSGDLTDHGQLRTRYITALQAADQTDYVPLLAFVRT